MTVLEIAEEVQRRTAANRATVLHIVKATVEVMAEADLVEIQYGLGDVEANEDLKASGYLQPGEVDAVSDQ